jgi:hypothetical protein
MRQPVHSRVTSAIVVVLGALAVAMGAPLRGAAPGRAIGVSPMPRTPDGHPDLQGIWNNSTQTPIVQTPGYLTIVQEMIHEARIIPLDGRPHAPSHIRSYLGDSRGRWEGDTLAVETTNFRRDAGDTSFNC